MMCMEHRRDGSCGCGKTPPDARTQPTLPREAAQIRTAHLRLLLLSLQEAKGSFPCLCKSPDPSAPEQTLAEGGRMRATPAEEAASEAFWSYCATNSLGD